MDIAETLSGGDRRSIGRSDEVVSHVLKNKLSLAVLFEMLTHDDAVVRMRAADALEKISAEEPRWLDPYAARLLTVAAASGEQEIRWHTAQMLPRLKLSKAQRKKSVDLVFEMLSDTSRIAQAFALTALVNFAERDAALYARVAPLVKRAAAFGAPSMKARAKALEKRLSEI
jgi:vesicle coat complex subunit